MDFAAFLDSPLFRWGVLPLLIFCTRICDVSVGTVRVIFVARGYRTYAAVLAFFEVAIWLVAIGQIMRNLDNAACFIAYASGYASGTYVGIWLEAKIRLGKVIVRAIVSEHAQALVERLRALPCNVTSLEGQGATGPVTVVFSIVRRHELPAVVEIIKSFNPKAFYSVEDVRYVTEQMIEPRLASAEVGALGPGRKLK